MDDVHDQERSGEAANETKHARIDAGMLCFILSPHVWLLDWCSRLCSKSIFVFNRYGGGL